MKLTLANNLLRKSRSCLYPSNNF